MGVPEILKAVGGQLPTMNMDSHQHELNLITGFLGVPGYILSTFFPNIQQLASRQPRLVKILCVFVALSTVGVGLLERIKQTLLSFLVSYFMFSTTIESVDPLYSYIIRWLKDRRKLLPEQELQARSKEEVERNQNYASGSMHPPPLPYPGQTIRTEKKDKDVIYDFNGLQIFWHNWRPFFVAPYPRGRLGTPTYLTVRCFGFSSQPLRQIIDEAWKIYRESDHASYTAVYRPVAHSGGWRCVARRNRRALDTIVLDPVEKSTLLEDITFYLSGEAKGWYAQRGIPYRRGYLFHGRPGTGKTSLSMAIAGHFGLDIYIISLVDPNINDTFLHTFFTNLPKGALILLEDIDSAGVARESFEKSVSSYSRSRNSRRRYHPSAHSNTKVTLSGLLNAIDGADSPEGHLLIMTTNAPEALDEALIRPGRIDYKIGFKAVEPPQAREIFQRMYQGDCEEEEKLVQLAEDFSQAIPGNVFTAAELQGHLLRHKKLPFKALSNLNEWKEGVLGERRKLDEARQKKEDKKKRKKSKDKKGKNGDGKTSDSKEDDDDDSSDGSNDEFAIALSNPAMSDDYDSAYPNSLNGDPSFGHGRISTPYIDPIPLLDEVYPPPRRPHKSRGHKQVKEASWDDINGRERTCCVM